MTSPKLAIDSPYGRLYRHPATLDDDLTGDVDADIRTGALAPSVTNVISVLDKPFLTDWYARQAADAAVQVSVQHPGHIAKKPKAAREWIADAAKRYTNAAADLGNRVHGICELLARGEDVGDVPEDARPYVDAWHAFADDCQPTFLHVESTVFGDTVGDGSGNYAGTADFVAVIEGVTVVGDLKSGRSIHTEAALQLSALAHATTLVREDDSVEPFAGAQAGLVVHLTPKGYSMRAVSFQSGEAWEVFCSLRSLWQFHVRNLQATAPLMMSRPLRSPRGLLKHI